MISKCPECGSALKDEMLKVAYDYRVGIYGSYVLRETALPVLCAKCPKCGWFRPYEYVGDGKCPKCKIPMTLVCDKCGHDIVDFMSDTTIARDWRQDICRCCDNYKECKYLCSAWFVIIKLVKENILYPARIRGGIPLFTGLQVRNPFTRTHATVP
jgi:hypothetical protein